MKYDRRDFLMKMGVLYGSSALLQTSCSSERSKYLVFTDNEASCIIALCEQLIPADHDAGATDAGVIHYIDRQTYLRFPRDLQVYQKGVAALQATCNAEYGKKFEELDSSIQIEVMQNLERGRLSADYWEGINQQTFFNLMLNRTMQGFYGPPRHGGNKNYVSYRMLKLDYPLVVGQNRYRDE